MMINISTTTLTGKHKIIEDVKLNMWLIGLPVYSITAGALVTAPVSTLMKMST